MIISKTHKFDRRVWELLLIEYRTGYPFYDCWQGRLWKKGETRAPQTPGKFNRRSAR